MIFQVFVYKILRQVGRVKTSTILMLYAAHAGIAYGLFVLAGEAAMTETVTKYLYYWMTTASTVGYGDISPATGTGQAIVTWFFIPTSIMLFGLVITKASNFAVTFFRKEITGMLNFNHLKKHILIMGYHPLRTQEMVSLILADKHRTPRTILIASAEAMEHPFLDVEGVEFCHVTSLRDAQSLQRVALAKADKIIVDGADDNASFVLASHYATVNPTAHITTHIADIVMAENLQQQHENIEVVVDNREELMIRTMQDHGTSRTVSQLLRADEGQTFFVTEIVPNTDLRIKQLEHNVQRAGGIFLGVATDKLGKSLVINPDRETALAANSPVYVHYINIHRLPSHALNG